MIEIYTLTNFIMNLMIQASLTPFFLASIKILWDIFVMLRKRSYLIFDIYTVDVKFQTFCLSLCTLSFLVFHLVRHHNEVKLSSIEMQWNSLQSKDNLREKQSPKQDIFEIFLELVNITKLKRHFGRFWKWH